MLLNFLNCKYIIPGFINFTNWVCHVVIFITFLLFYKSQPPNKCLRQSYILVLENNQRHILYKSMKYIDWEGLFKWNRQYSIWWFSMNHQIISMKGTLSKFLNLQIEKNEAQHIHNTIIRLYSEWRTAWFDFIKRKFLSVLIALLIGSCYITTT